MENTVKVGACAIVGAVLLLTMASVLYVPVTPLGKTGMCEKELRRIGDVLRGGGGIVGRDFPSWRTSRGYSSGNKPVRAQMCEYCKEFSACIGEDIFTIGDDGGFECLLDPWGHAYHVGTLDEFKGVDANKVNMAALGAFMVGEWVLWSSGPNGIDESGGGDDVCEFKTCLTHGKTGDRESK